LAFNIGNAKAVLKKALAALGAEAGRGCDCGSALKNAIVTDPRAVPAAVRRKLGPLLGKYLR
jgi:5'-methylthioadenosine phosphorylase